MKTLTHQEVISLVYENGYQGYPHYKILSFKKYCKSLNYDIEDQASFEAYKICLEAEKILSIDDLEKDIKDIIEEGFEYMTGSLYDKDQLECSRVECNEMIRKELKSLGYDYYQLENNDYNIDLWVNKYFQSLAQENPNLLYINNIDECKVICIINLYYKA